MPVDSTTLSRREVRRILKANHGSMTRAAKQLRVAPVTISLWLRGEVQSKRLDEEIPAFAATLLVRKAS